MTEDQVRDILRAADEAKAARATDMPDDNAAMRAHDPRLTRARLKGYAYACEIIRRARSALYQA